MVNDQPSTLHETDDELAARLVQNHMPKCHGILNRAVDKIQAELENADVESNFAYELVLTLMMRVVFFRRAIADYTAERRGESPITTMDWLQQELNDYNDEIEARNEADAAKTGVGRRKNGLPRLVAG